MKNSSLQPKPGWHRGRGFAFGSGFVDCGTADSRRWVQTGENDEGTGKEPDRGVLAPRIFLFHAELFIDEKRLIHAVGPPVAVVLNGAAYLPKSR